MKRARSGARCEASLHSQLLHTELCAPETVRCVAASLRRRRATAHDILNTTHHSLHHGPRKHDRVLATLATPAVRRNRHPRPRRVAARSRPPTLPRDAGSPRNSRTPAPSVRMDGLGTVLGEAAPRRAGPAHGLTLRQPAEAAGSTARSASRIRSRRRACPKPPRRARGPPSASPTRRPVVDAHGLALVRRPRRSAALESKASPPPAPTPASPTRRYPTPTRAPARGSASSRRTSSRAHASSAPTHRSASSLRS